MEDCETIYLLNDIANMNGRRWRSAFLHFIAQRAEIVRRDLGQQAVLPNRQDIPVEDSLPHRPSAFRHTRFLEPTFADGAELLSVGEPPLLTLLLLCW